MLLKRSRPQYRIIGLDLSLNSTGYAFAQSDRFVTGRIKPGKLRGAARLAYNRDALTEILASVNPTIAVVEGYSMGSKGNVFNIGEWGGVARVALFDSGCKQMMTITPSVLKKLITGKGQLPKGKDGKAVMMAAVNGLTGERLISDDEADALALYIVGDTHYRKTNRYGGLSIKLMHQLGREDKTGIEIECF